MAFFPQSIAARRAPPAVALAGIACVLVLLGLAGLAGAAEDFKGTFQAVTDDGAGPAALHGQELVWFGLDGVLHLRNLTTGAVRSLTALPEGVGMQSLAFDGTWVAWCDNRFGDLEAFAMHVDRLALTRLSRSPAKDSDIAVGGGHAAWLHDDKLVGTDLAAPAPHDLTDIPGLAFTPVMDGDLLVWSQIVGQGRHLLGMRWGGNATLLTLDPTSIDTQPVVSGDRVAWRSELYSAKAGTPDARSLGLRIQVAAVPPVLALLSPVNVTTPGLHDQPSLGGSWLAWVEKSPGDRYTGIAAFNLDERTGFQRLMPTARVLASETHLVVAPLDGTALQAYAWGQSKSMASAGVPLGLALLLGSAWVAWRRHG